MRYTKFSLLLLTILACLFLATPVATAQEQSDFGGNKASDYQPPTGNPQSNPPSALQPTNTAVQPVTPLSQQGLTQSGGLPVSTASEKGATSTGAERGTRKIKSAMPTWIIGGLLTVAAVAYILFKPDEKSQTAAAGSPKAGKVSSVTRLSAAKKPVKKTTRRKRNADKK